ncbi:hypothetical protein [Acuticoccus sp.]|uniref:hypothetical protein n=1 Tax=Acuticoccus sp. TaxID=1904378 RepID=UPI003B52AD4F
MFVYSAYDAGGSPTYLAEACVSARSLRRWTDAPITLWTNRTALAAELVQAVGSPFSAILPLGEAGPPKAHKIDAIGRASGDRVFLDTDTIVLADIGRVFEFADFDIAAVPVAVRDAITSMDEAVRREPRRRYTVNSGVLFVRGRFAGPLCAAWAAAYRRALARSGPSVYDQPSLARALEGLQPDLLPLPHNYNLRVQFGGLVSGAVFVVHVHYRRDLAGLLRGGLDAHRVDALIDRVAAINASTGQAVMPPIAPGSVLALDLSRRGRPRSLARRVTARWLHR